MRISATFIILPLLPWLVGCFSFFESTPDFTKLSGSTIIEIIELAPFETSCRGMYPVDCYVVDGELFYEKLHNFEYEEGYVYTLKVAVNVDFENDEIMDTYEAPKFDYRVIEVLSKEKSDATFDDYFPNTDSSEVTGIITEIQSSLDGYLITLTTSDDFIYLATISLANFSRNTPNFDFNKLKVGNSLTVDGEFWSMEKDMTNHITVFYAD